MPHSLLNGRDCRADVWLLVVALPFLDGCGCLVRHTGSVPCSLACDEADSISETEGLSECPPRSLVGFFEVVKRRVRSVQSSYTSIPRSLHNTIRSLPPHPQSWLTTRRKLVCLAEFLRLFTPMFEHIDPAMGSSPTWYCFTDQAMSQRIQQADRD